MIHNVKHIRKLVSMIKGIRRRLFQECLNICRRKRDFHRTPHYHAGHIFRTHVLMHLSLYCSCLIRLKLIVVLFPVPFYIYIFHAFRALHYYRVGINIILFGTSIKGTLSKSFIFLIPAVLV